MTEIVIRPYKPEDEAAIQEITYRTGFNGEDLTARHYFDDPRLFFLIFIYDYVRFEPEHCFVAVSDDRQAAVVGFICGTPDTVAQEARFAKEIPWRIGFRAFAYTSWRYPRTFKTLIEMTRQREGLPDQEQSNQIVAKFPAHLHINLMPGYQGLGIGSRLIQTFEDHMRRLGVSGVHLTTTNQNFKAVPFYQKMGFRIQYQSEIVPHPYFDDLRFLIFAKTLMNHL